MKVFFGKVHDSLRTNNHGSDLCIGQSRETSKLSFVGWEKSFGEKMVKNNSIQNCAEIIFSRGSGPPMDITKSTQQTNLRDTVGRLFETFLL